MAEKSVCVCVCVCVHVEPTLTQNGESGRAGPHGGLDGLALEYSVVHQLHTLDTQVMLSCTVVSNHCVAGVACNTHTHRHTLFQCQPI